MTAAIQMPTHFTGAPSVSGRVASSHLRLTRRGRFVITTLAAIPVAVGAFLFAVNGGMAAATGPGATTHFDYVTVQSGQSLWGIAEKVAPSADPRDVIADIVSLNQLQSAVVTPGQRIAIPAQYETGGH